jgi:type VI secretion system protein ImpC
MNATQEAPAAAATTTQEAGLLDQVIGATKYTERNRAEDLIRTLTEAALQGTVTYSKNVTETLKKGMKAIDEALSKQLAAILHNPALQKLEGTWRGLHYLVMNSETSAKLKIKVLNVSKRELFKDVDKASEFDQSQIFKKLYENEFGSPGGEPYGALIGDYEFSNHPEDVDLLTKMSHVTAPGTSRSTGPGRPSVSRSHARSSRSSSTRTSWAANWALVKWAQAASCSFSW